MVDFDHLVDENARKKSQTSSENVEESRRPLTKREILGSQLFRGIVDNNSSKSVKQPMISRSRNRSISNKSKMESSFDNNDNINRFTTYNVNVYQSFSYSRRHQTKSRTKVDNLRQTKIETSKSSSNSVNDADDDLLNFDLLCNQVDSTKVRLILQFVYSNMFI